MLKFIIICLMVAVIAIITYFSYTMYKKSMEDQEKKEDKYWKKERNSLQVILLDKIENYNYSELLNHLISYDLFKDDCIKNIIEELDFNTIRDGLRINDDKRRPNEEKIREYVDYIFRNDPEIDQYLVTLFVDQVEKNIEEGEKIEKEHETIAKAYGNDDNVQLRKAEKEEDDEDVPDSTMDDLYKSKLIEDLDDEEIN